MSFMRFSTEPRWEDDADSAYVYMQQSLGETPRLTGFDGATAETVVEVVMQMLEQSDHLDDDELEKCHQALRYRLHLDEDGESGDVGRSLTASDATMSAAEISVWAKENGHDEIESDAEELYYDIEDARSANRNI